MELQKMGIAELRALAKEMGIPAFQKGKEDLRLAIEDVMGIKRGKSTWKPSGLLDVVNKESGFRYRWCENTPENVAKKSSERWAYVESHDAAEHRKPDHVHDGSPLTSHVTMRDMVLMRITEEDAAERDAYFRELTRQQTVGIKKDIQTEMDRAASEDGANVKAHVHGQIIIE